MTLDIEEYRIIKALIELVEKAIKEQRVETQLALDSLYRDEAYKRKKVEKLQKYERVLEWLKKQ